MMTVNYPMWYEVEPLISCETQRCESMPDGYPVLRLGDLAIFPTREILEQLRDVVTAYLEAKAKR